MAGNTRALISPFATKRGTAEMGINLGVIDRLIRGAVGAFSIAAGLLLVKGVLGAILCLIGAVLIFSATVGFCHVYKFFHIHTSRKA